MRRNAPPGHMGRQDVPSLGKPEGEPVKLSMQQPPRWRSRTRGERSQSGTCWSSLADLPWPCWEESTSQSASCLRRLLRRQVLLTSPSVGERPWSRRTSRWILREKDGSPHRWDAPQDRGSRNRRRHWRDLFYQPSWLIPWSRAWYVLLARRLELLSLAYSYLGFEMSKD